MLVKDPGFKIQNFRAKLYKFWTHATGAFGVCQSGTGCTCDPTVAAQQMFSSPWPSSATWNCILCGLGLFASLCYECRLLFFIQDLELLCHEIFTPTLSPCIDVRTIPYSIVLVDITAIQLSIFTELNWFFEFFRSR